MAVQTEVKLVCDRCIGTEAGVVRATQTRRFGKDGQQYEMEVCDKHGEQLDKDLEIWLKAARKAGMKAREIGRARASARKATTSRKGENYEIGDYVLWAQMKGYKVNPDAKRPNPRLLREFLDERAS